MSQFVDAAQLEWYSEFTPLVLETARWSRLASGVRALPIESEIACLQRSEGKRVVMDEMLKDVGATNSASGPTSEEASQPDIADADRREFVKAGLVAAPLILTLRGRSALAGDPKKDKDKKDPMKSKMSSTHSSGMLEPLEQHPTEWAGHNAPDDQV